jgi:hypothetical protein
MSERMWGHDAIRIEMPYSIAKIISDRDHPHRDETLNHISTAIASMIADSSLIEPSPISIVLNGIVMDGDDMSMGPCIYIRKVFMDDVERLHATFQADLGL